MKKSLPSIQCVLASYSKAQVLFESHQNNAVLVLLEIPMHSR